MAFAFIYGLLLSLVTATEFELQGEGPNADTKFVIHAHGHVKRQDVKRPEIHYAIHPAHKSGPEKVTAHLQRSPKTDAEKEHAMTMETQKSVSSQTSGAGMVRRDTPKHEALHKKMDETETHGMKHSKSTIMARVHSRRDARANVEKVETMSIQAQKRRKSSLLDAKQHPVAKAKEDKDSKLSRVGNQKQNREQSRQLTPDRPFAKARKDDDVQYSELSSDVGTQKQNHDQGRHLSNAKHKEADKVHLSSAKPKEADKVHLGNAKQKESPEDSDF